MGDGRVPFEPVLPRTVPAKALSGSRSKFGTRDLGRTETMSHKSCARRRSYLKLALATVALCALAPTTGSAAWEPTRTVEIIVPAGTGGGADQMARGVQGIVTKHNLMKQPMVVINKAGGAG